MATERNPPAGDAAELDDDVDGRIAALYGGPLAEFVAQRDALAKSLRSAGRRDDASRIKALKKPKALAWALDAGAHAEPAALADLTAAVEEVGEAQVSGGDVRAALSRLRTAETAILAAAGAASAGHGHPVDGTALAAGLRAVVGDPDALAALGAGRLVDVPGTGGFGAPAPAPGGAAGAGSRAGGPQGATGRRSPGGRSRPGPTDGDREAAVAAARQAVAEAERAAQDAAEDSRTASEAADEAEAAARRAEDEAVAARRRADAAADAARLARAGAEEQAAHKAEADAALAAARDTLRTIGPG